MDKPSLPLTIRMRRDVAEHLALSEEGRFEDSETALAEGVSDTDTVWAYTLVNNAVCKTKAKMVTITIESGEQAADLYYAVCSGTFQLQYLATAKRLAEQLRELVRLYDPELVKIWPEPSGR